ncbi:hypothetical protein ES703_101806 [subsurface metagenome]
MSTTIPLIPMKTIPTIIPAVAVASATVSIFLEPAINPSPMVLVPLITAFITAFAMFVLFPDALMISRTKTITIRTSIALKAARFGVWRITTNSYIKTTNGIR